MLLKIFDFASLFQVALGINLAVPFFPDAIIRTLTPTRQTLESLLALQGLITKSNRGEYLGEISKLRKTFEVCADDTRRFADQLSIMLIFFAALSFGCLYFGSANPTRESGEGLVIFLLVACFVPPLGSVVALYLYSRKRSADVRIEMQEVYSSYIEKN